MTIYLANYRSHNVIVVYSLKILMTWCDWPITHAFCGLVARIPAFCYTERSVKNENREYEVSV